MSNTVSRRSRLNDYPAEDAERLDSATGVLI